MIGVGGVPEGGGGRVRDCVPGSEGPTPDPRVRPQIRGSDPGSEAPTTDPRVRAWAGGWPRGLEAGRGGGVQTAPNGAKSAKSALLRHFIAD